MVAKTFSDARNFDLSEQFDSLRLSLKKCGYSTVPPITLLQIVSAILRDDCSTKTILSLKRDEFIDIWPSAVQSLLSAIDYLRLTLRIPVSELLPYNGLLVLFSYYFNKRPIKPSDIDARRLQDLFWRISLGGRYTNSVESKLAQDIKRVNIIISGSPADYDWPIDTSKDYISENGYFNAGRSYIKAFLCILVYQQPKSFSDNALVNINNDWLKRANSKNYHHFFPKSVLNRMSYDDGWSNHIANITFVDDHLNKVVIGSKKPSVYIPKLSKDNEEIEDTLLSSHLIDINKDGVLDDNYEKFFYARIERISRQIKKRIIAQQIDTRNQSPVEDEPGTELISESHLEAENLEVET